MGLIRVGWEAFIIDVTVPDFIRLVACLVGGQAASAGRRSGGDPGGSGGRGSGQEEGAGGAQGRGEVAPGRDQEEREGAPQAGAESQLGTGAAARGKMPRARPKFRGLR